MQRCIVTLRTPVTAYITSKAKFEYRHLFCQTIPKIEHLRDSKSADTIGAQLAKLPHKIPNEPNFLLSIPDIVRLYEI